MKNLKVNVTSGALIIAVLLITGNVNSIILPLGSAILIHEIGHIAAIIILGGKINAVTLNAGGLNITYNSCAFSYMKDVICDISGPFVGIFFAIIGSLAGYKLFGGISFVLNMFNLLPVRPLDGGRMIWHLLMYFDIRNANIIIKTFEITTLVILYIFALYLSYLNFENISLIIVALVLTFYYCKES